MENLRVDKLGTKDSEPESRVKLVDEREKVANLNHFAYKMMRAVTLKGVSASFSLKRKKVKIQKVTRERRASVSIAKSQAAKLNL